MNSTRAPGRSGPASALDGASPADGSSTRRSGRRRLTLLALVLVALAGATSAGVAYVSRDREWRDGSRHGRWLAVFDGYGSTTGSGSGTGQKITLSPARATAPADTHAGLVVTADRYGDFVATVRIRNQRQLRSGGAGSPNPWEVGWVVWHYTANERFYTLALEPTGWFLAKQDPAYPGGQRFLAAARKPVFPLGVTHTAGIMQIGNRIVVSGDGQLLANFTDRERPYLSGAFGLYAEDARVRFESIQVNPLRAPVTEPPATATPRQTPSPTSTRPGQSRQVSTPPS